MKLGAFWSCVRRGHVFVARGQLHTYEGEPSIWAWYCDRCHLQYGSVVALPLEKLPRRGGWRIWLRTLLHSEPVDRARDGARSVLLPGLRRAAAPEEGFVKWHCARVPAREHRLGLRGPRMRKAR